MIAVVSGMAEPAEPGAAELGAAELGAADTGAPEPGAVDVAGEGATPAEPAAEEADEVLEPAAAPEGVLLPQALRVSDPAAMATIRPRRKRLVCRDFLLGAVTVGSPGRWVTLSEGRAH